MLKSKCVRLKYVNKIIKFKIVVWKLTNHLLTWKKISVGKLEKSEFSKVFTNFWLEKNVNKTKINPIFSRK